MVKRTFKNLLGFAVCFALILAAWNRWFPLIPAEIKAKLDYFALRKDEYDVVFLGASTTRMGVDPLTFDAIASQKAPIRSFNFGINGLLAYEADILIERIAALKPKRLKTLFIETGPWIARGRRKDLFTERWVGWHDIPRTLDALRVVKNSALTDEVKREWTLLHLQHALLHCTNAGRWSQRWQQYMLRIKPLDIPYDDVDRREGFTPLSARAGFAKHFLPHFVGREADFIEFRILLEGRKAAIEKFTGQNLAENRRLTLKREEFLNSTHFNQIHLSPPRIYFVDNCLLLDREGLLKPHWDYSDPERFPDLYDTKNRYDFNHLNADGAMIYTRRLAERYAEEMLKESNRADEEKNSE